MEYFLLVISKFLKHDFDYLVFDSLSSLLISLSSDSRSINEIQDHPATPTSKENHNVFPHVLRLSKRAVSFKEMLKPQKCLDPEVRQILNLRSERVICHPIRRRLG